MSFETPCGGVKHDGSMSDDPISFPAVTASCRGTFWSTIRAVADGLFQPKQLTLHVPLMHTANAQLMVDLATRAEGQAAVEVMRPIQQLSLQIIGTAAFG